MTDTRRQPQVEVGQHVRFTFFSQKCADLDETFNRWKVEEVFPQPYGDDGEAWYRVRIIPMKDYRGRPAEIVVRDDQLIII